MCSASRISLPGRQQGLRDLGPPSYQKRPPQDSISPQVLKKEKNPPQSTVSWPSGQTDGSPLSPGNMLPPGSHVHTGTVCIYCTNHTHDPTGSLKLRARSPTGGLVVPPYQQPCLPLQLACFKVYILLAQNM